VPSAVALVPARSGSQRVPGKNVRPLAGHPLLAYTITVALQSSLFDAVVVSTDSEEIAGVARHYGAEVPGLRPPELAGSTSPDIGWVLHVIDLVEQQHRRFELFSILRPTSPFRTVDTLERAFDQMLALGDRASSLRAVELCRQHPGKMWVLAGELMRPLLGQPEQGTPFHSSQYQALPQVYVQNSSLELAWTRVLDDGDIAGQRVAPFLTEGAEGFSIDYPEDFAAAERLLALGEAELPEVLEAAYG
jgi:CMP-N,N'-diacetyllegionaminic acid synthase